MSIETEVAKLTPAALRERGSLKWTLGPPGSLGAFVAESDLPMAPVIRTALNDALDAGLTGYLPNWVAAQTSSATAAFQERRFGWSVDPSSVQLLPDVVGALNFTAMHLAPGRPIVIPTPAYMPFLDVPAALGRELRTCPMVRGESGRYRVDPDELRRVLDGGGLLVLVNPHNPTGQVATAEELSELAEIATVTGSLVFADEIHSPIVYDGHRHVPFASLSPEAARISVTAVSASKGWNLPGLTCAQLILTNPEHQRLWAETVPVAKHGTSVLGAVAARAAYSDAGVEHLDQAVQYWQQGRDRFARAIAESLPQATYFAPEATYLHWLDVRPTGIDPALVAQRTRVIGTDGADCGQPGFLRLTLATTHHIIDDITAELARLPD